jgi:hypothetical protein
MQDTSRSEAAAYAVRDPIGQRGGRAGGTLRGAAADPLALAGRGALIALGGTVLLAETSGRLLGHVGTTGAKQLRAWTASPTHVRSRLRDWRLPRITFGRLERKP